MIKKLKAIKFRTRLYIISFVLIFLPIVAIGIIASVFLVRQTEVEASVAQEREAEQVADNISEIFSQADKLTDIVYYNAELAKALLYPDFAEVGSAYVNLIYPTFRQNKSLHSFVSDFCIYAANDDFMSNGQEIRALTNIEKSKDWFVWLSQQGNNSYTQVTTNAISFYRKSNFYLSEVAGYIRIDVDKQYLCNKIMGLDESTSYIIKNTSAFLMGSNELLFNKMLRGESINNNEYFTAQRKIETSSFAGDASLISFLNRESVVKEIRFQNVLLISCLTGVFVLILAVFAVLIGVPLNSINKLSKSSELVTRGNFTAKVAVKSEDEIGCLCKNYNYMLDYLNELINESYIKEIALQKNMIQQQKSELKALQEQINPHFLYNTLDAIRMQAVLNDDKEVSEMLVMLAKLFKYNVGFASEEVTLFEEIEHLSNYLNLINIRKSTKYKLINNIENSDKIKILRFTIQPIVENSIKYAFCGKKDGEITISNQITEGVMIITVCDNGIGINEDKISEINNSLGKEVLGNSSIGLQNVYSRLVLKYGREYGLRVEKGQVGLSVNIFIPLTTDKFL